MLVRNLPRSFLLPVAATILCLIAASAAALDVTFIKIMLTRRHPAIPRHRSWTSLTPSQQAIGETFEQHIEERRDR